MSSKSTILRSLWESGLDSGTQTRPLVTVVCGENGGQNFFQKHTGGDLWRLKILECTMVLLHLYFIKFEETWSGLLFFFCPWWLSLPHNKNIPLLLGLHSLINSMTLLPLENLEVYTVDTCVFKKTWFILIWHCRDQRKIHCLKRFWNLHRPPIPPLYLLRYRANWDW